MCFVRFLRHFVLRMFDTFGLEALGLAHVSRDEWMPLRRASASLRVSATEYGEVETRSSSISHASRVPMIHEPRVYPTMRAPLAGDTL